MASLSLHHVEDLRVAVGNIANLLRTGGSLVVVEFAWDRIDEATAEWALERLQTASAAKKPSWLRHCCRRWACGGDGETHDHADHGDHHAEAHFAEWAGEKSLHDSQQVRAELERCFVERYFEWVPYLYPDLDEGVSEADENTAIESGTINATGFRYVGVGRALIEP